MSDASTSQGIPKIASCPQKRGKRHEQTLPRSLDFGLLASSTVELCISITLASRFIVNGCGALGQQHRCHGGRTVYGEPHPRRSE